METVHYVTQDPVQHLRLRVTLTRLSAPQQRGPAQQQQGQVSSSGAGLGVRAASVQRC